MEIEGLVALLRGGGVIACATETWFGLLADARSEAAVARVVALKQRGESAIALLVPDLASAQEVAEFTPAARALAEKHWPGPLSLVLRAKPGLPTQLLHDGTVGMRVPGSSPALELVRAFAGPLTATSCNLSGQPASRTAAEARAYFGDQLAAIVEQDAPGGPPSTLVDATTAELRILRLGAIEI